MDTNSTLSTGLLLCIKDRWKDPGISCQIPDPYLEEISRIIRIYTEETWEIYCIAMYVRIKMVQIRIKSGQKELDFSVGLFAHWHMHAVQEYV